VATSLLSEIFELYIEDRVLFPIRIVEVPPLFGVNLEILFLHGLAQKSTACVLPRACHRRSRQRRDRSFRLAILEGKTEEAESIMDDADTSREPEILVHFARHYPHMRLLDSSIKALQTRCTFRLHLRTRYAEVGSMAGPVAKASGTWLTAKQCRGSC
jgi:hypothetical protein